MTPTKKQLANREKWFAALTGGKFRQGKNCLREDDKFCCLGVCSQQARKLRPGNGEWGKYRYEFTDSGSTAFPPTDWFATRFGVSDDQAGDICREAAGWNDSDQSFKQIARRLAAYFKRVDKGNAK